MLLWKTFSSKSRYYIAFAGGMLALLASNSALCQSSLPVISAGGVATASAFGKSAILAPATWIEVYGTNLASITRSWSQADFTGNNAPVSLSGTSVTIAGKPAYISYISPTQLNAQMPSGVPSGTQFLTVTTSAGTSLPYSVNVVDLQPQLLAPPQFSINGRQYVAALFSDGTTFALPPGSIPGVISRRAQPGDLLTLYGIGLGNVTPEISAGQIVQTQNAVSSTKYLMVNSTPALIPYFGLAPQAVGLYQINFIVPNVSPSDSNLIKILVGNASSQQQILYLPVQASTDPATIQGLSISPSSVTGGDTAKGTYTLSSPVAADNIFVQASSDSALAPLNFGPGFLLPRGTTTGQFFIQTLPVSTQQTAHIQVSFGTSKATAALTINFTQAPTLPAFTKLVFKGALTPPVGIPNLNFLLEILSDGKGNYYYDVGIGTFTLLLSGNSFTSKSYTPKAGFEAFKPTNSSFEFDFSYTPGSFFNDAHGSINLTLPAPISAQSVVGTFVGQYALSNF